MRFKVAADVARALAAGKGVVALESALLTHGLPRPGNARLAGEIEAAVAGTGARPATVAVLDGALKVGLTAGERQTVAGTADAVKCSTRDLPRVLARGAVGGTTVAATVFAAAKAGIKVMATGGLGGVHRGGESSMDVSADLEALARAPVVVVCSGAKAILDLERTLERLETLGVGVVGFGCAELPGFYTKETGLALPRVDDLAELCALIEAHFALGLPGALVVAQPPPAEVLLAPGELAELVEDALRAARVAGIRGAAQTPFVLRHMAGQSAGRTVLINHKLVSANAELAGNIAATVASRQQGHEMA